MADVADVGIGADARAGSSLRALLPDADRLSAAALSQRSGTAAACARASSGADRISRRGLFDCRPRVLAVGGCRARHATRFRLLSFVFGIAYVRASVCSYVLI